MSISCLPVLPLNYTCMSCDLWSFHNNGYFTMVCAVCQVFFERDFWARGPTADPPPSFRGDLGFFYRGKTDLIHLGDSLIIRDMYIQIHRHSYRRVTKKFLQDIRLHTVLDTSGSERMTKRVHREFIDPNLFPDSGKAFIVCVCLKRFAFPSNKDEIPIHHWDRSFRTELFHLLKDLDGFILQRNCSYRPATWRKKMCSTDALRSTCKTT